MKKTITILILSCISFGTYGQNKYDEKLGILFKQSWTSSTTEAGIANKNLNSVTEDCTCVPYYLCSANNSLTKMGEGIIDLKEQGPCNHYLAICCNTSDISATIVTTIPPPTNSMKGCGYRNKDGIGFQVIGDSNNEAQFGEFPWMVAILTEEYNAGTEKALKSYKCGGALIHPSAVVTAAHCIISQEDKYIIRVGEWDTQTIDELLPHQERDVKNIVTHEDYNSGSVANNVAIIFLDKPVEIDKHVNTVCLPEQNVELESGTRCFASGWGKDIFGRDGKYAVILKRIELPIVDHNTCQGQLRTTTLGKHFELHSSFICAGGEKGNDTCEGDGGSPLVCLIAGSKNRYQHIGIVAWGIGCGEYNVPGVYVNVGMFRHWIDKQMSLHNLDTSYYKL